MLTYLIVFLILGTVIALMAVGVIFQNKPIKGSCGGMANLGMETECDVCGGKPDMCEKTGEATSKETQKLREHLKVDKSETLPPGRKEGDIDADHAMSTAMSTPRDGLGKHLELSDSDVEGHLHYDATKNRI